MPQQRSGEQREREKERERGVMWSEDYSAEEGEPYMWMDSVQKKRKRKRRFSDEQIRSLESMFERQEKLEPDRKLQLAGELGLQPRQVSIWFQNKRARWKTKQLEREHGALRAEYDALLSSFESLKREKQILTQQVQMLGELLEEPPEPRNGDCEPSSSGGCEGQRPSPPVAGNTFSKEEAELYTGDVSASAEQLLDFQPRWPLDQFSDSSQWWEFWPTE